MNALSRFACIVSLFLAFAGTSSTAYAEPFRIAYNTWVGYGPLFVAEEKGYFSDEGVDVHMIKFEEGTIEALFDNQVDAIATDSFAAFSQQPADERTMMLALALDDSAGGDGIAAIHEIRSLADLERKAVAYDAGTAAEFLLTIALGEAGLTLADIEAIDLDGVDGSEAFVLQEVEAVVTWEPHLTIAKNAEHGHLLTDSGQFPGMIMDGLFVLDSELAARRADIAAVARAWGRAVAFVKSDPDEAIEIMARNVGGWLEDPAEFAAAMAGIRFYGKARNQEYFGTPKNPGDAYMMAQQMLETLSELGKLQKPDLTPTDLIAHGIWD